MTNFTTSRTVTRPSHARGQIVFEDSSTWIPVVSKFLKTRLKANFIDRWKAIDCSSLYDDDPDWLTLLRAELRTELDEVELNFAEHLCSYTVRLVHGCRPPSLVSYMQRGICPYDNQSFGEVLETFLRKKQIALDRCSILERAEKLSERGKELQVFLALDERDMLANCGHYLVYGSEWLTSVLGRNTRGVLQRYGITTLLYVSWPLELASQSERLQFSHRLLREWVRIKCLVEAVPCFADFTFVATGIVDPRLIVGHRHPNRIVDPLEGFRAYRNTKRTCDVCCTA